MKIGTIIGCALLASLSHAAPAVARDQVDDDDPVAVQPGKAYIFYRTSRRLPVRFLREVGPAQRAAHEAERDRALARARRRSEQALRNWEQDVRNCGTRPSGAYCRAGLGERPVLATAENFAFPAPELGNFVTVERGPTFTRAEGAFTYLMAVDPGTYILYGQITETPQNVSTGTCLCMGSVRFEARPGQIGRAHV